MTIAQWIKQLTENIYALSTAERSRVTNYYNELFLDKCDSGMSESDAVASFGDPVEVANSLLEEMDAHNQQPQPVPSTANCSCDSSAYSTTDSNTTTYNNATVNSVPTKHGKSIEYSFSTETVNNVLFDLHTYDMNIVASSNNTLVVSYIYHDRDIAISLDNGSLTVAEPKLNKPALQYKHRKVYIYLPIGNTPAVIGNTVNGDIDIEHVSLSTAKLTTKQGDIDLEDCQATQLTLISTHGDIVLDTATCDTANANTDMGDIDLQDSTLSQLIARVKNGDISIDASKLTQGQLTVAQGDIELSNSTGSVVVATTKNGDIESYQCNLANLSATTQNGDIECQEDNLTTATLKSTNGEIETKLLTTSQLSATTVNGKIKCNLQGTSSGYDITAKTLRGKCNVPTVSEGNTNSIELHSTNGNIELTFGE